MLRLKERLQRFETADIVASYSAKFFVGLGVGLLIGGQPKGWIAILLALVVGLGPEIKFWRK